MHFIIHIHYNSFSFSLLLNNEAGSIYLTIIIFYVNIELLEIFYLILFSKYTIDTLMPVTSFQARSPLESIKHWC